MDITGGKLFSLLKPFEEEEEELVVVTSTCTLHYVFIMIHRCCMHALSSFLEVVTYNTFLSFRLLLQFGYNNVKYFLVPSITLPYIYFLAQSLTNDNMASQITLDKPLYGMQIMY